jgi:hypothetical protein
MIYTNGARYEGEFEGSLPHGSGVMTFASGTIHEGEFFAGQLQGRGRQIAASGVVIYEGSFLEGKRNGRGIERFEDGSSYEGDFQDGQPHGKGKQSHPRGDYQDGEWKRGKLDGSCVSFQAASKNLYEGECVAGEWSGFGRMRDNIKRLRYEGGFRGNLMHGIGTLETDDGTKYVGAFEYGAMHGSGELTLPSGETYIGDFVRGRREGRGVATWTDGTGKAGHYEGGFAADRPSGHGILSYGAVTAEGEFRGGSLSKGRIISADGRQFELDSERRSAFEVLPDGTRTPVSPDSVPLRL